MNQWKSLILASMLVSCDTTTGADSLNTRQVAESRWHPIAVNRPQDVVNGTEARNNVQPRSQYAGYSGPVWLHISGVLSNLEEPRVLQDARHTWAGSKSEAVRRNADFSAKQREAVEVVGENVRFLRGSRYQHAYLYQADLGPETEVEVRAEQALNDEGWIGGFRVRVLRPQSLDGEGSSDASLLIGFREKTYNDDRDDVCYGAFLADPELIDEFYVLVGFPEDATIADTIDLEPYAESSGAAKYALVDVSGVFIYSGQWSTGVALTQQDQVMIRPNWRPADPESCWAAKKASGGGSLQDAAYRWDGGKLDGRYHYVTRPHAHGDDHCQIRPPTAIPFKRYGVEIDGAVRDPVEADCHRHTYRYRIPVADVERLSIRVRDGSKTEDNEGVLAVRVVGFED